MARTITSTLLAAQQGSAKTPYFKYEFTSKDGGTTLDYTSRITGAELHYEAYNEYATILLYNNDNAIADIKGYYVDPFLGFDATGSGGSADEGEYYPRMWVKNMFDISLPGTKIAVLELEGQWKQLKEKAITIASEGKPFWTARYTATSTIFNILNAVIEDAGMDILQDVADDDGFINAFTPAFNINEDPPPYENYQQVVYRLIIRTKCYLRTEALAETGASSPILRVKYPIDTDAIDEEYYSDKAHWFKEKAYKTKLVVPNHVEVYCDKDLEVDADGFPLNPETYGQFKNLPPMTGSALDQYEIDRYTEAYQFEQAGDVHNQTDADFVAEALLDRAKFEAHGGRIVIPHDCRVELYDKVAVYDSRCIL